MSQPNDVEIRPAVPEDVSAIQELWDASGLGRAERDEMEALMGSPTAAVLVAPHDGAIVGTVVATFDGWRAYIYHLAVAEADRTRGVGHRLLVEAERYLTSAGARYVYVTVHQDNTEGLALVGATGYEPEGEIVLTKQLARRPA